MDDPGSRLLWRDDPRIAAVALCARPAWLWSLDATQILWANPTGATIFGAATAHALSGRAFALEHPAAVQVARLASALVPGASARLERLRGFGASIGRALTCECAHIRLGNDTAAILIVAVERTAPDLALLERVQRLLAGCAAPIAAFSADGALLNATAVAAPALGSAASLATLDAQPLAAQALAQGHAAGESKSGALTIDRLASEVGPILIATFRAESATGQPVAGESASHPDDAPQPPVQRRYPLRFVWQIDAGGRFTIGSQEFVDLIGPATAAKLTRPWDELVATLDLDPDGQIERALATHDTWSGLVANWPVDGMDERLAVELSGLPVFDRARAFRGYRGFGVCRDLVRLNELAQARYAAAAAARIAAESAPPHGESEQVPTEPAATPASAETPQSGASERENVVPFRVPQSPDSAVPTPVERRTLRAVPSRTNERTTNGARDAAGTAAAAAAVDTANLPLRPTPSDHADSATTAANDTRAAEDVARDADQSAEAATATDTRAVFDRFPIGILVYRLNELLYANRVFLAWVGHDDLEALAEAGGLDSLFVGSGSAALEEGKAFMLASPRDDALAEARLFLVPWETDQAFALIITVPTEAPKRPEQVREQAQEQIPEQTQERVQDQDQAQLAAARAEIGEISAILEVASDGVIVLDGKARIVSANRSAQALFGYDARSFPDLSFIDLFAPDSVDSAIDDLDRLQNGRTGIPASGHEVTGRRREGAPIPLFLTMARVGESGDKFCAVVRDVTRWKEAEAALTTAKRQAEEQSSAKSDFLAKISHEIRTPLNAVIGFSEVMMEERFGPIGNDRYRQYLKDIHTSGGHLVSLVNDLLDLSKIEAGKLDLDFARVALDEITQQCVAIMQPQANRERIIIRTSLSPKLPQVFADARSLRQIVLNLLSNSIKFTGAGGQVIVSTALTDAGEVILRVRDTGAGMSEQDLATALEPFRQLATSTRFGSGGTGLGLPLTKALAEANRATFRIKSAVNAGTLVEIVFPANRVVGEQTVASR